MKHLDMADTFRRKSLQRTIRHQAQMPAHVGANGLEQFCRVITRRVKTIGGD